MCALACLALGAPTLSAQTGSIVGRVLDETSGRPISGVEVVNAGSTAVLTQQNGTYLLTDLASGPHEVTFRRAGYGAAVRTVTVPTDGTARIDVWMRADAIALDEALRDPLLGDAPRRSLGYAVATLDAADILSDAPAANFQELLTGRVPGLRYTRLSGNIGTGSPMTLRSISTFSLARSQPVVMVDGVRVNSDPNSGPIIGSGRNVSALDDLSPEDVERVEVLRGPAAAALYGTEAASGVIQIFTHRGGSGTPQLSMTVRRGTNYLRDPADRLGTMWACPWDNRPVDTADEPYRNMTIPTGTNAVHCDEPSELLAYNMYDEANRYIRSGYFPWATENLYQNGLAQSYHVDVRGGTQSVSYFISSSWEEEAGYVWFNTDETFRLRANTSIALRDNLSLDLSTAYAGGSTRFASPVSGDGGEWQDMVWSNGFYLLDVTPLGAVNTNGTATTADDRPIYDARRGGFQEKLPADVPDQESTREYDRFVGAATLRHRTNEATWRGLRLSLSQRAVAGIDKQWDTNENIFPMEDGQVPLNLQAYASSWIAAYSENVFGTAVYERPVTTNLSLGYGITGHVRVGDAWSFATSGGAQYTSQEQDYFQNAGVGFSTTISRTINQIQQTGIVTNYSLVESKSLGFWVRQEASFRDRIFAAAGMRLDDNSTYGDRVRAQKFPYASAAWVISEESFWPLDAIGAFRLRGAWGRAGRQPAPLSNESIFTGATGLSDLPAVRPQTRGNDLIAPEITAETELGFDVSALDNRIAGSFTRYWRTTKGAIVEVDLGTSVGFPGTISQNLGQISGRGWEAQLGARLWESDLLTASLDVGIDHTDNEIRSLGGNLQSQSFGLGLPYPNKLTDDYVVSAQWGAGPGNAFNTYDDPVTAMCDPGVTLSPNPTSPDAFAYGRVMGGQPVPCNQIPNRWLLAGRAFATYTFSLAPRVGFLDNRLQVFALAEGQHGRVREANDKDISHSYYNSKISWLQDDPVWVYGTAVGDDTKRSFYDASFWKLREVGVRYSLPDSWSARAGADRASLSVSARNMMTIWQAQKRIYGVSITDPEFGSPTLDGDGNFYETPAHSTVNVTLRVTF